MTILSNSTESLQLITASAVVTDYNVSYSTSPGVSLDTSQSSQGNITGATTTTIVAAPEARKATRILDVFVRNKHATSTQTVTLVKTVDGTSYHLTPAITLLAGEAFHYSKESGVSVFDATGRNKTTGVKSASSSILISPTFTANDLTSTRAIGPGWSQAVYVGKAPKLLESLTTRLRVTTAVSVGGATEWCEVAVAKGAPVAGSAPTLTVVGFTSAETALASVGMHNVVVSISPLYGLNEDDDVWVLVGASAGTNPIIRAGLADNLMTGGHAIVSSRPSSILGTPTVCTLPIVTVSAPWIAAIT